MNIDRIMDEIIKEHDGWWDWVEIQYDKLKSILEKHLPVQQEVETEEAKVICSKCWKVFLMPPHKSCPSCNNIWKDNKCDHRYRISKARAEVCMVNRVCKLCWEVELDEEQKKRLESLKSSG